MPRKVRVAVINSHPIQYFAPLYSYLNCDDLIEITAIYCSDSSLRGANDPGFGRPVTWDVDLLSGYRAVFLRGYQHRTPAGFWSLVAPSIWSEIRSGRYDAVWLHGYAHAAFVLAFFAAKTKGLPVFFRGETHDLLHRTAARRFIRDSVLSIAARFVDAFLAIGSANRRYYRRLGARPDQIFDVPYAIDNARFIESARISALERTAIRAEYRLSSEPVILYASKLTPRKSPDDLIRACATLASMGMKFQLLMVGSGEMQSALKSLADSLGFSGVVFAGFVNQTALPKVYASCDVFVLPSENEPWGLVVNEVMCAGLPVIVSRTAGCAEDLVKDGVTGFQFEPGSVDQLTEKLSVLLANASLREEMGYRALERIGDWGYAECLKGLRAAVDSIRSVRTRLR